MPRANLESVLIIQNDTGLPLLHQKLDPRAVDVDSALVSGFLFAIQTFSAEFVNRGSTEFNIDYGERVFTIVVGSKVMLVVVSTGNIDDALMTSLRNLLNDFEENWYVDIDAPVSSSIYDDFRKVVIETLGIHGMSFEWIPYFDSASAEYADDKIIQLINGKRTIKEIIEKSGLKADDVILEMSRLWAIGLIRFRHMLKMNDVVIPNNAFYKFLQKHTDEYQQLKQFSPKLTEIMPHILSSLDGRSTVKEILQKHSKDAYDLLDFLLSKRAIEIVTHERKRILLAKELLNLVLEVAEQVYSKQQVIITLKIVLRAVKRPEITADLHLMDNDYKIEFGYKVYDGLKQDQLYDIHKDWLTVLNTFIQNLPKKGKKRFIEGVIDKLHEEFFDKFERDELEGIDEFTQELEKSLL